MVYEWGRGDLTVRELAWRGRYPHQGMLQRASAADHGAVITRPHAHLWANGEIARELREVRESRGPEATDPVFCGLAGGRLQEGYRLTSEDARKRCCAGEVSFR